MDGGMLLKNLLIKASIHHNLGRKTKPTLPRFPPQFLVKSPLMPPAFLVTRIPSINISLPATAFSISQTVSKLTDTAVKASISTPVFPSQVAVA